MFAGSLTELEYLRHIGVLDDQFKPVSQASLNLSQYLQFAALKNAAAQSPTVAQQAPSLISELQKVRNQSRKLARAARHGKRAPIF